MRPTRSAIQRLWEYALSSPIFSPGGALRVTCLWPLAFVYRIGLAFSRLLSPTGPRLSAPVVSVGALAAGGSGKTPFVASLLRQLRERNIKVGVVGSGYGRTRPQNVLAPGATALELGAGAVGDEIAELAGEFPDVLFSVGTTKRSAARSLANSGAVELILIDDGFQTHGLNRDLDIVLLSCDSRPADYRLLPAGRSREPRKALSRADVVVFTKLAETAPPEWLKKMSQKYGKPAPAAETFGSRNRYTFRQVGPHGISDEIDGPPVGPGLIVSALADNQSFQRSAIASGVDSGGAIEFDDHFPYDESCAVELRRECSLRSCSFVLTSAKDWTKLREFEWDVPVWVMVVRSEIENAKELIDLIVETADR